MDQVNTKAPFLRSDLACERRSENEIENSTKQSFYDKNGFSVTELIIENDSSYPSGRYVTVDIGKIWLESDDRMESCIDLLSSELLGFIENLSPQKKIKDMCLMIAGLGNRFITADSLGPLTVDKITVTRHMMGSGGPFDRIGCSKICAIQPGVLGQTGIEAASVIKGAADAAKPDLIIAVDALAARSIKRLATTVQISDTGICPGSGIGNKRIAVNRDSIGCPVIAIGVPTVVDSSTLVWDALEQAGIEEASDPLREVLENGRSFFVSPKDSDIISDEISSLIASAICRTAGI